MLYIIEGPDKCGKSTFIKRHGITHSFEGIEEFTKAAKYLDNRCAVAIHFGADDKSPIESLRICAAFSHICDIYMDRSWISELVYGSVYRGEINITPKDEKYIIGLLQDTPHIVYYFDEQIADSDTDDIFEKDAEKVKLVKLRYEQWMNKYKSKLTIYRIQPFTGETK